MGGCDIDVQPFGNDVWQKPDVHCSWPQLPEPLQLTSHAHALLHETLSHELGPEHVTLHLPSPHCTSRHEPNVEHVMSHDVPLWQSICLRHAPLALHKIVHA